MSGARSSSTSRKSMRGIPRARGVERWAWGGGLFLAIALGAPRAALHAQAQQTADTMAFYKALDLEAAGKYRDAAPLFRSALHTPAGTNALLGLERVYAEIGWLDSLVAPLDTLIAANPREETYRTVQLR